MPRVVPHPATYEDLLKVPEHLVAEIVDGELYASPRPPSRHARAGGKLGSILDRFFDEGDGGPGGWWIVPEPELHLGHDVLVPDIAGWRRERMPVFPDVVWFALPPDWICEVVSPGTSKLDRTLKLPRYARYEISYAWIIDPIAKTLEVYRREESVFALIDAYSDSALVRAEPFEACELNLGAPWID